MRITKEKIEKARNDPKFRKIITESVIRLRISESYFYIILFDIIDDKLDFVSKISSNIIGHYKEILYQCYIRNNLALFEIIFDKISTLNQLKLFYIDNLEYIKIIFNKKEKYCEKDVRPFIIDAFKKDKTKIIAYFFEKYLNEENFINMISKYFETYFNVISYKVHSLIMDLVPDIYKNLPKWGSNIVSYIWDRKNFENNHIVHFGHGYYFDKRILDLFFEKGFIDKIKIDEIFKYNLDIRIIRKFVEEYVTEDNFGKFIDIFKIYPEIEFPKVKFVIFMTRFGRSIDKYLTYLNVKKNTVVPKKHFDFSFLKKISFFQNVFTEREYEAINDVAIELEKGKQLIKDFSGFKPYIIPSI